ncbi:DUF402 domain-containing protein [Actinokineospora pegani]|uniref:DUF402 domain-containing protein n=1 Tax=Actinokineospora pegani TaxID=2654637 RepID=UPI0012EAE3BE|nr:hypothetical protein [Actinokineospora pegani]
MGTAITPQLVDIVDIATAVRSFSSGTSHALRVCQVERWGLRMEYTTPDDPFSDTEITWLLPEHNLRLTQQKPRSRHAKGGPSVLSAVRVLREGRYWRCTDLLLGLAAPGGTAARIVNSEEFAAAVAGRILRVGDADLAMCTVHRTLEELSRVRHDLSSWLAHKHIFEVWPPY